MNRVKELRLKMGIKQTTLAAQLNVAQSAISSWESGKKTPSGLSLFNLCKVFQVTPEYILGYEDENTANENETPIKIDEGLTEIKKIFNILPDRDKQQLIQYGRFLLSDAKRNP